MSRHPDIERHFHTAMTGIYRTAKDAAGYDAKYFLQMLAEHGGLETARRLLHADTVSDGYTELWKRHRLDLTVEALVIRPQWKELFTDEERSIALQRLVSYDFVP